MKAVKSRIPVGWIVTAPSHKRLQSFAARLSEHTHPLNPGPRNHDESRPAYRTL